MNLAAILNRTRGEVLTVIRGGTCTVTLIARELGLSENAVRSHLVALERDGMVEAAGNQPSGRRPAILYRLTDVAETFYRRGYEPVLVELAKVLVANESSENVEELFA